MSSVRHLAVPELNAHLTCSLCTGYLVDATTIMECLHSFCRSCLVRYFDLNNTCPKCKTQVHKTRPLLNIRPDKTLQDLVYKLVPGLFRVEMERRRTFYGEHQDALPNPLCPNASELRGDIMEDRFEHVEDEKISLTFQHYNRDPDKENVLRLEEKYLHSKTADRRYLLCPGGLAVEHLKKFVRHKFDLADELNVEVFHSDEVLRDNFTLADIAELYSWRRMAPLKLYYLVHQRQSLSILPAPRPTLHLPTPVPPKRRVVILKKKVKRLRTPKVSPTSSSLLNGALDVIHNGIGDVATVAATSTTTSPPAALGAATSPSSVEQCRGSPERGATGGHISVDTVCDSLGSSSEGVALSPRSPAAGGRSPTNNNESAVSSPCKNCPQTGCAHVRKTNIRLVVTPPLFPSPSPSSSDADSSQGSASSASESNDSSAEDSTPGSPAEGATGEQTIKMGFSYRQVVAPNFSGVLKIPIVGRKVASPVGCQEEKAIDSPASTEAPLSPAPSTDTKPADSPPHTSAPTQVLSPPHSTDAPAGSPRPSGEKEAHKDKPIGHQSPQCAASPAASVALSPSPVSVATKNTPPTTHKVPVIATAPTAGTASTPKTTVSTGEDSVQAAKVAKPTCKKLQAAVRDIVPQDTVSPPAHLAREKPRSRPAGDASPSSAGSSPVIKIEPMETGTPAPRRTDKPSVGVAAHRGAPLRPVPALVAGCHMAASKLSPPGVTRVTDSMAARTGPLRPVPGLTRLLPGPAPGRMPVSAVKPPGKPSSRGKRTVGAHGGSPSTTPPRSPSRSTPQPILPKGPCGPMAHGCVPAKRVSPQGNKSGSPPKRMRLNVCHGVQNIQSTVAMTTSAMRPHLPTIAHSGHPVFMTSVPHVLHPVTFGRHVHPAFLLPRPAHPPIANGYDAPLELTTKRRDS